MLKTLVVLVLLAPAALSQSLPSAPQPKQPGLLRPRNLLLLGMAGSAIAADGYTTQGFLANTFRFRESNPIARPFGNSRGATIGLDSLAFAGTISGMALAHHKRWHRLEWIIPVAVTSIESGYAIHNASLHGPHLPKGPVHGPPIHFVP